MQFLLPLPPPNLWVQPSLGGDAFGLLLPAPINLARAILKRMLRLFTYIKPSYIENTTSLSRKGGPRR